MHITICECGSTICGFVESLSCLKNVSRGHGYANLGVLGARMINFF
jgi:hypothetical protein